MCLSLRLELEQWRLKWLRMDQSAPGTCPAAWAGRQETETPATSISPCGAVSHPCHRLSQFKIQTRWYTVPLPLTPYLPKWRALIG